MSFEFKSGPERDERRTRSILWLFPLIGLLHLLTNGRYEYFRDELYYIACSRHLGLGYVDMAPLCAWILRLQSTLFGNSLFALRLFPALAGALTIALTGAIARELGGRAWSVVLACTASLTALVYLGVGNFYSMNVFEPLFWMGCVYLLVRIINLSSQSASPPPTGFLASPISSLSRSSFSCTESIITSRPSIRCFSPRVG